MNREIVLICDSEDKVKRARDICLGWGYSSPTVSEVSETEIRVTEIVGDPPYRAQNQFVRHVVSSSGKLWLLRASAK